MRKPPKPLAERCSISPLDRFDLWRIHQAEARLLEEYDSAGLFARLVIRFALWHLARVIDGKASITINGQRVGR